MDSGLVLKTIGHLLIVEAVFMIAPLGVSIYYGESDFKAFFIAILITAFVGTILSFSRARKEAVRYKEGFMIVGLGWLLISIFGAIPFLLAGTFDNFIDAFFETVSGFTTTGASVLKDIESQPHGILFWRSLTHWLGGMGVLAFTLSLLPAVGMSSLNILKAESTGPTPGKLVPKIAETARILYIIYILLTGLEIIFLKIGGMPLFDAVTHTFATVGTGGFSTKNKSIAAYNMPSIEWVIMIFTFLAGVNFSLYYDVLMGKFKSLFKDREFQFYCTVIGIAIILITINITDSWGNILLSFRQAAFQVVTIITSTGFATLDYSIWPAFSKMILFILMFFGGCAGSTSGGIKILRVMIVFKYIKREFYKLIHPNSVISIRIGGQTIPENVVQNVIAFVLLYFLIFAGLSLILLTQDMDLISSTSAVVASLSNIGPGFGSVGPAMNYAGLTTFTKILLSFTMILGRLEIYTVLILITPIFWKD
ncbi:MAG TPA: TrkH family potassium uptake protein [Halanaerobiales bacterium]|nr:TrkH family potassium uptake protein [Halanaerobiales bacterium]HPZ62162.1 TrkH family potassium uptake protein [Halanaerobiales bacterium]HQD03834.1 TrkH family potassium uptake protein [Halanaerobiales bacterium]